MKVAVFWPNWIGDAVMATPAVRALREHFAHAELVGVVKPYVSGVLEGNPWLDRQIRSDGSEWASLARQLRQEGIDLAVLFPNSFRSAWVAWLGGCRRRIGFARLGRSLLLTERLIPVRDRLGRRTPAPVILDYNRLAMAAGCPEPSLRMQLYTTAADEAAADAVWRQAGFRPGEPVVLLNAGAAFGAAKFWPAEYFVELAQALVDRRGVGVLVLCGPAERAMAQSIADQTARSAVHSLSAHVLSLGLTKACVRRATLLITTDSGPRHFAAAFDRPVLTLFGPTHIAWTETSFAKAVHLQKSVSCGPCQRRVCPLDHRCMRQLTPGEVYAAATALLDRFGSAKGLALSATG